MSELGKQIRLKRLIEPSSGCCIVCALDHGLTSPIFLEGLYETRKRVREAIAGGANTFMLSRGISKRVVDEFQPTTALALMLSASAACRPEGSIVTPIGSVDEAITLGADAVVVYSALAGANEPEMINYLDRIGAECARLGLPFIAEAEYPDAYQNLESMDDSYGSDYLMRNARICAELGADIVKVNWSGDKKSFGKIIKACDTPVIIAGGSVIDDEEFLTRLSMARSVGAIGCSVGRNIFQHQNPEAITRAICRVMKDEWPVRQALQELREALNS